MKQWLSIAVVATFGSMCVAPPAELGPGEYYSGVSYLLFYPAWGCFLATCVTAGEYLFEWQRKRASKDSN